MVEAGLNARSAFQRASGLPPSTGTASRPISFSPTPARCSIARTEAGAAAAEGSSAGRLADVDTSAGRLAAVASAVGPAASAAGSAMAAASRKARHAPGRPKPAARRSGLIPLNIRGSGPGYTASRRPCADSPHPCASPRTPLANSDAMSHEVSHAVQHPEAPGATTGAEATPAGDEPATTGIGGSTRARTAPGAGTIEIDPALIERFGGRAPRYTSYPSADRFHAGFGPADYRDAIIERGARRDNPLGLYF